MRLAPRLLPLTVLSVGILATALLPSLPRIVLAPSSAANRATTPRSRIYFSAAYVFGDSVNGYGPDRQIYSIEPSGWAPAQLTFEATPASAPVPSPDGRLIAFSRGKALWVMRPDGRGQKRLALSAAEPTWAPTSRTIAYVALGLAGQHLGIRRINADGSGDALLVHGSASSPALSPDGGSIAFARTTSLVVRSGGKSRTIARGSVCCISWSPDGKRLLFIGDGSVDIASADGRNARNLGQGSMPAWSPNGRSIAFLEPDGELVVVDLRTLERRLLPTPARTPDPLAHLLAFSWSPNGDTIVYSRGQAFYPSSTYLGIVTLGGRVRFLPSYPQAADLSWSTPPVGVRYRPPEPEGPRVAGQELRARGRIGELAVNGDDVALGFCVSLAVWPASYPSVEWLVRSPLCSYTGHAYYSAALAGGRAAWGVFTGGNFPQSDVAVANVGAQTQKVVASGGAHTDGRDRTGWVLGRGDLLVFSSRKLCEDFPAPNGRSCAADQVSQRPVLSQTIWRIHDSEYQGMCPFNLELRPGPCEALATEPGSFAPTDVDSDHIVAVGDNAVVVMDARGTRMLEIPIHAVTAQLTGQSLVVLVQGSLRVYDLPSGALAATWPLPDVVSGGVCRASPCNPSPRLRLDDAGHGLVAYLLDRELHMFRLRDGADAVIARATAAQFGSSGLFYAYEASYPWVGRIRYVPYDRLPLR